MISPLTPPGDPGPADRWHGDLNSPCRDTDVLKPMQIVCNSPSGLAWTAVSLDRGRLSFSVVLFRCFFMVLFSFSVVLFSVSVVVFSFFLVRGGSMRNPRSVNNYQRQRQRTKRTSSLKS